MYQDIYAGALYINWKNI